MPKQPSLHKQSVVKHATRGGGNLDASRAGHGGGTRLRRGAGAGSSSRGGFHVGPKHAPDGSYLGRAKKIKAQLIEHAKVKKAFYKGAGARSPLTEAQRAKKREEGRFAPQDPVAQKLLATEEVTGPSRRAPVKESTTEPKLSSSAKGKDAEPRGAKRKRAQPGAPEGNQVSSFTRAQQQNTAYEPSAPHRTREEATKERAQKEKKAAKTNRRGQPNLGARIELLLGKIGGPK